MKPGAANPKSVVIMIGAGNEIVEPPKGYGRPGAHIVFVIHNEDDRPHRVRIPPNEFQPKAAGTDEAGPHEPCEARDDHWARVEGNDVGTITLKVKHAPHFAQAPTSVTYKYTVYSADGDGKHERVLDPEIEINN